MKYKLRIYKQCGLHKGDLDHEELFSTKEEMDNRYKELFKRTAYALNPTAWESSSDMDESWKRLSGY